MKSVLLRLAILAAATAASTLAATGFVPGSTLVFQFPDLPPSLQSLARGVQRAPKMTVRLPDNYAPTVRHPVFIYQTGGAGGNGDEIALGLATAGPRDFVVVNLPLFKATWNKNGPAGGLLVTAEDYGVISESYRAMLTKLYATIPNLTRERSVFGGHSNGAHTTAVLLEKEDPTLLEHFPRFFLHEGGQRLLLADAFDREPVRSAPLLVMMGAGSAPGAAKGASGGPPPNSAAGTRFPSLARINERLEELRAQRAGNFTLVRMAGYGHEQPPEYLKLIGQWARGEPLDDVPATMRRLAAALRLPLTAHPDTSAWPDLLNADLSTHRLPGGNVWSYRDGILSATEDKNIWTRREYRDCVLDFEFKFEPGANSGVFLYNSDAEYWMPTSVEIQICDDRAKQWAEKPPPWRCGAFFGHQAASKSTVKPAGEWNRMTVACTGPRLTVVLNHEVVNEIDLTRWSSGRENPDGSAIPEWLQGKPWSELPTRGRIGFQGRHAGAGIEFRRIKLLRLDLPAP